MNLGAQQGHRRWAEKGEARRPCSEISREVDEHAGGSSTSRRARAAKKLHGQARGDAGRRGSAPAAEHPPAQHCSSAYPPNLEFCKIRPNFELKTKTHQNQSYSEFYKLQFLFWCPRLNLSGKRLIWPNSLKIKTQFKGIQIFELGQFRISKITFVFPKQLEKLPT